MGSMNVSNSHTKLRLNMETHVLDDCMDQLVWAQISMWPMGHIIFFFVMKLGENSMV